jgi:hypothetical protein
VKCFRIIVYLYHLHENKKRANQTLRFNRGLVGSLAQIVQLVPVARIIALACTGIKTAHACQIAQTV